MWTVSARLAAERRKRRDEFRLARSLCGRSQVRVVMRRRRQWRERAREWQPMRLRFGPNKRWNGLFEMMSAQDAFDQLGVPPAEGGFHTIAGFCTLPPGASSRG